MYLQGLIYHYLGSQRLAEKTLRDAAKIDPNSHQTWYYTTSINRNKVNCEYIIK